MAFVLASFNALDLFDAADPRLPQLAGLLRPHAPDVVALQEIGGADVAEAFGRELGGGYVHVVGDRDERGICVGLLSRRPVLDARVLRADHLSFPRFRTSDPEPFADRIPLRRSIPDVVVDAGPLGRVRVFVVHFKSRRAKPLQDGSGAPVEPRSAAECVEGEVRAVVWRCAEALFVRRALDERLAAQPDEKLVVCGDFNDVGGSLPLRVVRGAACLPDEPGDSAAHPPALVNVTDGIPLAERVSVVHDDAPACIDHALLTPSLAAHLEKAWLDRSALGAPGASDHAPLVVRFGAEYSGGGRPVPRDE